MFVADTGKKHVQNRGEHFCIHNKHICKTLVKRRNTQHAITTTDTGKEQLSSCLQNFQINLTSESSTILSVLCILLLQNQQVGVEKGIFNQRCFQLVYRQPKRRNYVTCFTGVKRASGVDERRRCEKLKI